MDRSLASSGALAAVALAAWMVATPLMAAPSAMISKLNDVSFSNLNPMIAATNSQSICVYSSTANYSVTATGSGSASAFTLSAGGSVAALPYSVAWSASSGQSSGTALSPGVPLTGLTSTASGPTCVIGLSASASLIVSLSSSDLQQALAGVSYTGVLTITIKAL